MARTFRRPRQSHPIAELNVTNLIDLGFTLLIIFMIATTFSKQEQTIPVNLPSESKKLQTKPDPKTKFLIVAVDARGRFFLDGTGNAVTIQELRSRLQRAAADTANPPVVKIRADKSVPYEKVVTIMDELGKVNLTKFSFDTQEKE
jgi:biopolymer transport protein ExbD